MVKKFLSFVLALVMTLSLAPAALAAQAGFSDVGASAWYYADVMECARQGIVTGYDDGRFLPENQVTDAQFIVMLTRTFYNDKVEAAKATAAGSWYAPNLKAAADVGMTNKLPAVSDTAMNRYDMALALYNTMKAKNKQADTTDAQNALVSIADLKDIPSTYKSAVAHCFAQGIITGMDGGKFCGDQSMTRAQACAVIMRMIALINGETPTQPTTPTQPETPQQTSGTLANGKAATTENVWEVLDQIKEQYPDGTIWGPSGTPNNNWYKTETNDAGRDVIDACMAAGYKSSRTGACGGWMAMVSDTIFGMSGAPAREVTKVTDLRPGDMLFKFDANTGKTLHACIVLSVDEPDYRGYYRVHTCDGNMNGGYVYWDQGPNTMTQVTMGAGIVQGLYIYRAFTRYPE